MHPPPIPVLFFFCCCLYGHARLERGEVPYLDGHKLLADGPFLVLFALPNVMTERNGPRPCSTGNRFGECVQACT